MALDEANPTSGQKQGVKSAPIKAADPPKKFPRPIVFWSLNEKTAYRRNRVVQTRMNMIMEDLVTQRETSRKTIRFEAHKFRQKNSKHYSHPLGTSLETQATGVNIAPPNWKPPGQEEKMPEKKKTRSYSSDEYSSDDQDGDDERSDTELRKRGIITRGKKTTVTFSAKKIVPAKLEHDLKIDDIENENISDNGISTNKVCKFSKRAKQNDLDNIRSVSAAQCRDESDLTVDNVKRHQSAYPKTRPRLNGTHNSMSTPRSEQKQSNKSKARPKTADPYSEFARDKGAAESTRPQTAGSFQQQRRSEHYFDKSKAAYQLRQDLKRMAKMRKQGVKETIFTLNDALNLEKEKYIKSKEKVTDYIQRIEAHKKIERTTVNRWTVRDMTAI